MYDITHKTPGTWVQFGEREIISDMSNLYKIEIWVSSIYKASQFRVSEHLQWIKKFIPPYIGTDSHEDKLSEKENPQNVVWQLEIHHQHCKVTMVKKFRAQPYARESSALVALLNW